MTKLSFIDLFGVPGGMSHGFKMAGFEPIAALDVFDYGLETYSKNFPKVPSKNIFKADAGSRNVVTQFRKITGLMKKDVDLIIGGPPCQGFSVMGRIKIASLVKNGQRKGKNSDARFINDKRNNLYKAFVKFVDYYKPKAVVIENVPGMMSYKNGWIVKQIKQDFKKIGFKNIECRILNAVDFGVPQYRKRIFFVATRNNAKILWPKKTHFEKSEMDRSLIDPEAKQQVTVKEAIGDMPVLRNPQKFAEMRDVIVQYTREAKSEFQRSARTGSIELHNHITRWHRPKDVAVFSRMKPGGRWNELSYRDRKLIGYSDESFIDKWKKLPLNKPSWTVVSHLHKDGYMYIHPTQNRTISVREAARLQSFPDSFVFAGSRSAQFKQIGNAVPPLLAKAVAKKVKKMLNSS